MSLAPAGVGSLPLAPPLCCGAHIISSVLEINFLKLSLYFMHHFPLSIGSFLSAYTHAFIPPIKKPKLTLQPLRAITQFSASLHSKLKTAVHTDNCLTSSSPIQAYGIKCYLYPLPFQTISCPEFWIHVSYCFFKYRKGSLNLRYQNRLLVFWLKPSNLYPF